MENGSFSLKYPVVIPGKDGEEDIIIYMPGIEFNTDASSTLPSLNVYGTVNAYAGKLGGINMDNNHLNTKGNYGSISYKKDDI